jgi:hypothetical protein
MAREYLLIVQESAYKTPVVSPVVYTNVLTYNTATAMYIRLDGSNAFTMRPRPVMVNVPYGGGFAVDAYAVSDKQEVKGQLTCKLSIGQAPMLLGWAAGRINSGQTSPWTTTEPPGDLASCSVYHAIQRSDGTYKKRVYLGTKVDSWSIACSEESTVATLTLGLTASTPQGNQFDSSSDPTSAFPAPAENNYASDPYVFVHTGGDISIGGSTRTQITDLTIAATNVMSKRYFNSSHYLNLIRFLGRKTTTAVKLLYAPSPDDRTSYEGVASEAVSVEFNNGTHTMTIALNAQNVFGPFEDDLALTDMYFQGSTLANLWDPSATADVGFTFT